MNIFGVGGTELVLILLIMLVVAGPKRMVRWAYIAGQYLGQLRLIWQDMVGQLQKEIDDAGVDVKLPKEIPTRRNINKMAKDALKPISDPVEKSIKEYQDETERIRDSVRIDNNGAKQTKKASSDDDAGFGTWSNASPDEQE